MIRTYLAGCAVLALALGSCQQATQNVTNAVTATDAALSSDDAKQAFQMACWSLDTADVAFKVFYASKPDADPSIVADEAKAIAGAKAICATPPSDLKSAASAILASYRAVTAKVPAS